MSEWIKCSDRLPEYPAQLVLVVIGGEDIYRGRYVVDEWMILEATDYGRGHPNYGQPITHWMPIPKPPEPETTNAV